LRFSSTVSAAIGSTTSQVPPSASCERTWRAAPTGSPMSCSASNTQTRSNGPPPKSLAPATSKRHAIAHVRALGRAPAASIEPSW
jgi:hypothetical protein